MLVNTKIIVFMNLLKEFASHCIRKSLLNCKLFIMEKDKRYHKRHMALTGSNRGDRHNRDMLIDSSLLGVDGTAELIESVAKKVFQE